MKSSKADMWSRSIIVEHDLIKWRHPISLFDSQKCQSFEKHLQTFDFLVKIKTQKKSANSGIRIICVKRHSVILQLVENLCTAVPSQTRFRFDEFRKRLCEIKEPNPV